MTPLMYPFGNTERPFKLRIGELRELQVLCGNEGPLIIAEKLADGSWRLEHVREVIRLALIGGGAKQEDAFELTRRYVDDVPNWLANAKLASLVMLRALMGDKTPGTPFGDKQKKEEAENPPTT